MRFVRSVEHEAWEATALPEQYGKRYAPLSPVTLRPGTRLGAAGVEVLDVGGERLHIHAGTASWAFLNRREAALFASLDRRPFGELAARWPSDARLPADEFVAVLHQRGLLTLDGQRAVDERVFADGPNSEAPHLVELLVTEKCNLACGYCLAGASPKMPTMSEEVGKKAVDLAFRMSEASRFAFEFSGGEPFLQFPLMQRLTAYILSHPERRGREVALSAQSNATLLDEPKIKWAKENDVTIGVSIDGDPASHDKSRPQVNGKGSFAKVIRGIDLLQRYGVRFGVLVVLNRANVGSAQGLMDFLAENGLYSVKVNPVAFLGTGRENWDAFGLEDGEIIEYFLRLMDIVVGQGHPLYEATLATMCQYIVSKQRNNRCMRSHCGAGTSFQCVSASGEVFPCGRATQSPALAFARVLETDVSLSEAARKSEHVQSILQRRPEDVGCGGCAVRELCQSGCAVQAFERFGTVRHKTPECAFFKTLYPYLMRRLSYDADTFTHLNRVGYFQAPAERVDVDVLPEDAAVAEYRPASPPPATRPPARLPILSTAGA
jgi:uncharacterized protein